MNHFMFLILVSIFSLISSVGITQEIPNKFAAKIYNSHTSEWIAYTKESHDIFKNNERTRLITQNFYYFNGDKVKHISTAVFRIPCEIFRDCRVDYTKKYYFEIMSKMNKYGHSIIDYCANLGGDFDGLLLFVLCSPAAGVPYVFGSVLFPIDLTISISKGSFSRTYRALRKLEKLEKRDNYSMNMKPKLFNALKKYFETIQETSH